MKFIGLHVTKAIGSVITENFKTVENVNIVCLLLIFYDIKFLKVHLLFINIEFNVKFPIVILSF